MEKKWKNIRCAEIIKDFAVFFCSPIPEAEEPAIPMTEAGALMFGTVLHRQLLNKELFP